MGALENSLRITNVAKDGEKLEPCALRVAMLSSAATMENSTAVPPKIKQNFHKIQQFHFWAYILKN